MKKRLGFVVYDTEGFAWFEKVLTIAVIVLSQVVFIAAPISVARWVYETITK